MKLLALLGMVAAASAASVVPEYTQFRSWMTIYNKTYTTDVETQSRFINYQYNTQRAQLLNAASTTATYGDTKFMDMSPSEFRSKYLTYRPRGTSRVTNGILTAPPALTVTSWDWSSVNGTSFLTPVKDQGDCGSCWAVSAVENIESQFQISTKKQVVLSLQQVVSCELSHDSEGCEGGFTEDAMDYSQAVGLTTEAAYPYVSGKAVLDTCDPAKYKIIAAKTKGYGRPIPECVSGQCLNQDENKLAAALASFGPMSICVDADDDWMYYQKGVMNSACSAAARNSNHCVQLTAFIQDTSWTLRNSWGSDWGEGGFMRLPFGENACGLASDPIYALF